jgi:hypothetical protein
MSYAIEVRKVPVRLKSLAGENYQANFFLHSARAKDYQPETVGDRLNALEVRFLPCEIDGCPTLVRLTSLAFVELAKSGFEVERMYEVGAYRERVALHLTTGDRLEGDLLYEAATESHRVSDLLNRSSIRFLMMLEGGKTFFILKEAIDRVELQVG